MSFDIHVRRRLGQRSIGIDLRSDNGIVALFGPSGAGKTSILNMVAGLLQPDWGRIAVAGTILFDSEGRLDLSVPRRRCGYIFQDDRLFPHMSVEANLRYGEMRASAPAIDFAATVDLLGLATLLDRRPATLSGGEAQRVAIGRALLSGPAFFLMDEPLASLDRARRDDILDRIAQLHALTAIPILYVSHDRDELLRLTSEIVTIAY
ncbi:MAG: ATP-binding cassette domain-containing protein [Sphingobium sp.]